MKHNFILSFLFLALFGSISAQNSASKGSFIAKVTPVTILRNMWFTAHAEYAFSDQMSIALGFSPNLAPKSNFLDELDQNTGNYFYEWTGENAKSGFSIDPEFRWYSDNMMDGFFIGAYSSLRFGSSSFIEYEGSFADLYGDPTGKELKMRTKVMVFGPQLGWEKLFGKSDRFVFDGYFGLGVKITGRSYSGDVNGPGFENSSVLGLGLRGNVSLGYRIR
jgi:hypothetical protein